MLPLSPPYCHYPHPLFTLILHSPYLPFLSIFILSSLIFIFFLIVLISPFLISLALLSFSSFPSHSHFHSFPSFYSAALSPSSHYSPVIFIPYTTLSPSSTPSLFISCLLVLHSSLPPSLPLFLSQHNSLLLSLSPFSVSSL